MSEVNSSEVDFPFSNVPDGTFMKMEEAGVVFLPAVGYRNGGEGFCYLKIFNNFACSLNSKK